MKHLHFLHLSRIVILSAALFSCHKIGGIIPHNPPETSATADSLSNILQFNDASKIEGQIPGGASGSSLKISFEDTLFLVDQVKLPIKFLHTDTTENVSGVFLQVLALDGGSASYYYDVPEVKDLDSSDTVSVIMMGIDPTGWEPPLSFNIVITPYDIDKKPIDQAIQPVKIMPHKNDLESACGLELANNDTWDWVMSYIDSPASFFISTPEKVWGADGQFIKGSCCAGISIYGTCPGSDSPNTHLHFNTFYQISGEQITFYNGNTFDRRTVERGAVPLPDQSDFCLPLEGITDSYQNETLYYGTYTTGPGFIMPDIKALGDSVVLRMETQFSDPAGGGYGNGGGVIHYLDCRSLVLIQQDLEGFGQHLYKIYHSTIAEKWFDFN